MASVDRRPNGKWRARWREYPGGPQKAKHFNRKIDAERHLVEVQHLLMTGAYVSPELARVTLDTYAEQFVGRLPWRRSSAYAVANALTPVRAEFGRRPLGTIRKGDVQAFVTKLAQSRSPGGVAVVFQHFNALLGAAVEDGLIARNPAKGVKLPSRSAGEVVPPIPAQVAALYDAAEEWLRPAVVLGAGLGLRQGEVSGLTADRIDWLGRTVRVDRQWNSRRGAAEFGPPKSVSSNRTIPAAAFVLDRLSAHVGRRHEGFVVQRNGGPVNHNDFAYYWRKAAAAAGVAGMRFHELRHAYASVLISAGCSVRAVQHALGHAKPSTTLNLYSHLWPGDEDRLRRAVDDAFGAPEAEDPLRTEGTEG